MKNIHVIQKHLVPFIYITNDEKPKSGDLTLFQGKIHKCIEDITGDLFKKIILTNDPTLINNGIQAIDKEFLNWFFNNPNCKYIEVEKGYMSISGFIKSNETISKDKIYYNIIIPKEELWTPKQDEKVWIKDCSKWSLGYYIGFDSKHNIYFVRQIIDDENSIGPLLTSGQKVLPYSAKPNEFKKETLEDAARKYYENNIDESNIPRGYYEYEIQDLMLGFAKQWQQQNSLSEEDIIQFSEWVADSKLHGYSKQLYEAMIVNKVKSTKELVKVWFDKYKKK